MSRRLTSVFVVMALAGLTGAAACGDGATEPPPPDPLHPVAVAVSPATVQFRALGATAQLVGEVRDQDGQPMPGATVTWVSSADAVVVVNASGLVTAVANGTATITASAGSVSGTAAVLVEQQAVALQLTPEAVTFRALGDTLRLIAGATDANGHAVEVVWSSSDTKVATVDASGLVTGVGNGSASITAAAGGMATSVTAHVEQEAVELIGLSAVDTLLWYGEPGDTLRLEAGAADANGHSVDGLRIGWSSSRAWVATVDTVGLVRGAGEGVTTITATAGGLQASTELSVVNRDRAALIALYRATDGPNWERNRNWLQSLKMRDWQGVTTNLRDDGVVTVTGLSLPQNNLTGTLPAEIGRLTSLSWLDLKANALTGPIPPELGRLTSLELLSLWDNDLIGPIPPELGNLTALERLWLLDNQLTGSIPPSLGQLASLRWLNLSSNTLTGPIPPELGSLTNLENLQLSNNDLIGPVPAALSNLAALESLWLLDNLLTGSIPPSLGQLENLYSLNLSRNALTGPIPPELARLTSLRFLSLEHNALTGPIPPELGSLTSLEYLSLETNALTGPIPPELGSLAALEWLNLGVNKLTGSIPWEIGNLAALRWLNLGSNFVLSGSIPPELGNLAALESLYLDQNALIGPIPPELGNLASLRTLHLYSNDLAGPVPPELGNLAALESLWLHDNAALAGALPLTLTQVPLTAFYWNETQLCSPTNQAFQRWLQGIARHRAGPSCQ